MIIEGDFREFLLLKESSWLFIWWNSFAGGKACAKFSWWASRGCGGLRGSKLIIVNWITSIWFIKTLILEFYSYNTRHKFSACCFMTSMVAFLSRLLCESLLLLVWFQISIAELKWRIYQAKSHFVFYHKCQWLNNCSQRILWCLRMHIVKFYRSYLASAMNLSLWKWGNF